MPLRKTLTGLEKFNTLIMPIIKNVMKKKEDFTNEWSAGENISSFEEPYQCKNGSFGRDHHIYDNGLHPCGKPVYPVICGNGQRRSIYGNGAGILSGNADDGCIFQLSLCIGTRHGLERFFCLYSCRADGLHLACCTGSSICGRDHIHRAFLDKCARSNL